MDTRPPPRRAWSRDGVYRQFALWHGYLSAFAFLTVIFFAVTGVLLNHPTWVQPTPPAAMIRSFQLTGEEAARIQSSAEPGRVLADIAADKAPLRGAYRDGDAVGDAVSARLQGVRGASDVRADLGSRTVEVLIEPRHPIMVIQELHRGEFAGWAWRLFADGVAGVLILLSLIGYVLLLGSRERRRTALVLAALGLAAAVGLFYVAVG